VIKIEKERETAIEILAEFEEFLKRKNIKIPSDDRAPAGENDTRLYGSECYELEDAITDILKKAVNPEVDQEGYFPITSVHRYDVKEALKLTDEQASKITDGMMREIARKMADDYCEQLFWDSLTIIAETVFEREGVETARSVP